MRSLLRWWRDRNPAQAAPRRREAKLALEQLEDRRVPATMSAASSQTVFVIRPDQSLWEYSKQAGWLQLTSASFAASISAVHESATGNDVVFALTTQGWLYEYHLGAAWQPLGGYFNAISTGTDAMGRAEVFALTNRNGLFEFNSTGATHLGDAIQSVSATRGEILYALLTDGSISKHTANGWFSVAAAGSASSVAVVSPASGSQVYFTLDGHGFVSVGGQAQQLLGNVRAISAGTDASGNAVVYAVAGSATPLGQSSLVEVDQGNGQFVGQFVSSVSGADQGTVFVELTDQSVWSHSDSGGWVNIAPGGFAE